MLQIFVPLMAVLWLHWVGMYVVGELPNSDLRFVLPRFRARALRRITDPDHPELAPWTPEQFKQLGADDVASVIRRARERAAV